MEITRAAKEWAKAEIISSMFFMLFGFVYISTSLGLWKFADTPLTEALIIPLLIAGGLLLAAGIGFYFSNKSKLNSFEKKYKENPSEFISSEIARTESTIKSYQSVALKVFPTILVISLIASVIISNPTIRAICITITAFFFIVILLDSRALIRIKTYHNHLETADKNEE